MSQALHEVIAPLGAQELPALAVRELGGELEERVHGRIRHADHGSGRQVRRRRLVHICSLAAPMAITEGPSAEATATLPEMPNMTRASKLPRLGASCRFLRSRTARARAPRAHGLRGGLDRLAQCGEGPPLRVLAA